MLACWFSFTFISCRSHLLLLFSVFSMVSSIDTFIHWLWYTSVQLGVLSCCPSKMIRRVNWWYNVPNSAILIEFECLQWLLCFFNVYEAILELLNFYTIHFFGVTNLNSLCQRIFVSRRLRSSSSQLRWESFWCRKYLQRRFWFRFIKPRCPYMHSVFQKTRL